MISICIYDIILNLYSYSSFKPIETFHWVKTPSFQFTSVDTSGRMRPGTADDSINSQLGRKRFLGAVSHWDYPISGELHGKPWLVL